MKLQKVLAVVFSLVMVTGAAALPASAAKVNVYSTHLETLANDVVAENGDVVPAGTTALTVSLSGNTGFSDGTFTLTIGEGYEVMTDENGEPLFEKGSLMQDFHVAVAATETNACVAYASADKVNSDGELVTLYLTGNGSEEFKVSELKKPEVSPSYVVYSLVGDANGDGYIGADDAATIYSANSAHGALHYQTQVEHYKDDGGKEFHTYFPLAFHPVNVNCWNEDGWEEVLEETGIDIRVINQKDGDEILTYIACTGSGNTYTGLVGQPGKAEF